MSELRTARLRLVAFDARLARMSPAALAAALGARVPPGAVDEDLWADGAQQLAEDPARAGWLFWFVIEGNAVVGTAGFKGPPEAGEVELGYGLVGRARGRGLATEAARALVAWAREQGARAVVAHVEADNPASRRVLEKLDFAVDGPEGAITRYRWHG